MFYTILIISGSEGRIETLKKHVAHEKGMVLASITRGDEALAYLLNDHNSQPDVVIYDLDGDKKASEVLRALRFCRRDLPVIALANHATINLCVDAMENGATDFLLMPFQSLQLTVALRNAVLRRDLMRASIGSWMKNPFSLNEFQPQSESMTAALFLAKKMAENDAPLALQGTVGVGRELFARAIHGSSSRNAQPFEVFNPSIMEPERINEELFGSEDVVGMLERVGKGTAFIRNIEACPAVTRQRLSLVVRGEMPIQPRRSNKKFEGRMMVAVTQTSLRERADYDKGNEAFYSHINALVLTIPSLAESSEDIPFFAHMLCRRFAAMEGRTIQGIAPDAMQMLRDISWTGNIAQLSQCMFHAVMNARTNILHVEDFRTFFEPHQASIVWLQNWRKSSTSTNVHHLEEKGRDAVISCIKPNGNVKCLDELEEEVIRYALTRYNGHMSDVARHLGIGRSTLYRKISSMAGKK